MKFKQNKRVEINGWSILLSNNVYMFYHSLSVEKKNEKISIPCEDLPTKEKMLGIWLDDIDTSNSTQDELRSVMLAWANEMEVHCQIYLNEETYTNKR